MLDLQPITLARLIDKLCGLGLVERRDDAKDRRANRLFLTREGDADPRAAWRAGRRIDGPRAGGSRRGGHREDDRTDESDQKQS